MTTLLDLVKTTNFAWFIGHLGTVISTVGYFGFAWKTYYQALFLSCVSYGITMLYPPIQAVNIDYLLLCITCFMYDPFWPVLIPLAGYSVLHSCTYISNTIIAQVYPHMTQIKAPLDNFVANQDSVIRYVAIWEIVGMGSHLLIGLLMLKTSFFLFVGYVVFIRRKYQNSALTRQSFSIIHLQMTKLFEKFPPALGFYLKFSNIMSQMAPVEAKNS